MKENKCLNFMKGISCLIVILLHYPIPGIVGEAVIYGLRFSVPIFFMISGYFCFFRDLKWIRRSQWKILKLLLCSETACMTVSAVFEGRSIGEQLREISLWTHPVRMLMFGTLFNGTLWYLYAMVWTWGVMYLLKKSRLLHKSYPLIPLLLTVHIVGRLLVLKYGDISEWVQYFCSWFLYGVPFVLLGHLLAEKEAWIRKYMTDGRCLRLLIAGGVCMAAEYLIWHTYMDIWPSTVMIALALFIFAVLHPDDAVAPVLAKIGKEYSMVIYVSQIPVGRIVNACVKPYMPVNAYEYLRPLLVILGALLVAAAVKRIRMTGMMQSKKRLQSR